MPSIQARAKKLNSMKSQFHLKATAVAYRSKRVKYEELNNPWNSHALVAFCYQLYMYVIPRFLVGHTALIQLVSFLLHFVLCL